MYHDIRILLCLMRSLFASTAGAGAFARPASDAHRKYHPILRPSVLTAFLGYVLVVFALLFDLGRPDRLWHPLVMWNPHSVMFEVAWCVTLYTTVLALEFVPAVLEKFERHKSLKMVRTISVPLMIAGVILSTL